MTPSRLLFTLLAAAGASHAFAATDPLKTVAEQSGFKKTGRYDEVVALCERFGKAYPDAVRCTEFGRTPEGRPMLALVASRTGALTPEQAREQALPVLLIQGGIHSGEIDGKDAGFLALREALVGRAAKGALAKQVLVFVPVFNIDGHERFGRWNRPNQRGPEEMGWRTTAQNYNLNRDYLKADAPEMRAMLGLINQWDPVAYIDLHVTDGAQFEHDVSIQVEPVYSGDDALRQAGRALRDDTAARLTKQGSLPLTFYPSFVVSDDPASGFADGVPPPRFSTGYLPLRNRFGMLVETHSWKDYPTRVRITRNTIVDVLELTAAHGAQWRTLQREA
ncbi:MAG TPA: M14 family metallopeptidase, partial [Tahibacter sp.]|nr:M14 family metallopeptidase [Tahibacter sp.]